MWQYIDPKKCLEFMWIHRWPDVPTWLKNLKLIKPAPRNGTFPSSPISDPCTLRTISPASKTWTKSHWNPQICNTCASKRLAQHPEVKWRFEELWRSKPSTGSILQSKIIMKYYLHIIFYKTKKNTIYINFTFFLCALLAGDAGSTLRMRIPLCPLFRPSAIRILSAVNGAFRVKMSSRRRNHNRRIAIIWQESE